MSSPFLFTLTSKILVNIGEMVSSLCCNAWQIWTNLGGSFALVSVLVTRSRPYMRLRLLFGKKGGCWQYPSSLLQICLVNGRTFGHGSLGVIIEWCVKFLFALLSSISGRMRSWSWATNNEVASRSNDPAVAIYPTRSLPLSQFHCRHLDSIVIGSCVVILGLLLFCVFHFFCGRVRSIKDPASTEKAFNFQCIIYFF